MNQETNPTNPATGPGLDKERSPDTPSHALYDRLANWTLILGFIVFPLAVAGLVSWDEVRSGQVESVEPIGALVNMSSTGGWERQVVVETERGFYPLESAVTLAKGTPLALDTRRSGRRYVCDVARTLCVATTRLGFPNTGRKAS